MTRKKLSPEERLEKLERETDFPMGYEDMGYEEYELQNLEMGRTRQDIDDIDTDIFHVQMQLGEFFFPSSYEHRKTTLELAERSVRLQIGLLGDELEQARISLKGDIKHRGVVKAVNKELLETLKTYSDITNMFDWENDSPIRLYDKQENPSI